MLKLQLWSNGVCRNNDNNCNYSQVYTDPGGSICQIFLKITEIKFEYLKPYNCDQIIHIKSSYLKIIVKIGISQQEFRLSWHKYHLLGCKLEWEML